MVRRLAPSARGAVAALAPHDDRRAGAVGCGFRLAGRGAVRTGSDRSPAGYWALAGNAYRGNALSRLAQVGGDERDLPRPLSNDPGLVVRLVHGIHRDLDVRRLSRYRNACPRALGDVGLRGGSEVEDPRHQG